MLNYSAFETTPLKQQPYDYIVVERFIKPEFFDAISADFPAIEKSGSYPPSTLDINGAFAALMDEMDGPKFRRLVEEKFDIDLSGRPTMYTVRGHCAAHNGKIHRDSNDKVVTVLLYMNDGAWNADGGRLRILNSQTDLNDMAEEVNPNWGTLLIFRCTDDSWHGHESFEGVRRVVQMNWVVNDDVVKREQRRHRFSAGVKKIGALFGAGKSRQPAE